MSAALQKCLEITLGEEGGYTDDPRDPGNWTGGKVNGGTLAGTKFGISAPVLSRHLGRAATAEDMKSLTVEQACAIYEPEFWAPLHGDALPLPVAVGAFDAAVNSGPGHAVRWLQQACGLSPGTAWNVPTTLKAIQQRHLEQIVVGQASVRLAYLRALPTWATYGHGWQARVERIEEAARELIAAPAEA